MQGRHALIESHRPYAQAIAAEICRSMPPHVDANELRAAAELGLTEAATAFDARPGVRFSSFAYYRIRGAIYDAVRKGTPGAMLSLDTIGSAPPPDRGQNAEERLIDEERRARLREAIPRLPSQKRRIIEAYYFEERNLEDIGAALGLSKSWVCRLHAQAIASLRVLFA